eukprot:gnl/Dysnectes_brevis/1980_a2279_1662.p1 GENE.gnl/Dysnectes_brevis/1980_a2279_1662~~gnl/Dysnectes_brevis/1980_a2279_1662.p1  ORF type:complete len:237 (-),score=64.41 gnl/Dysnectes_brevis/1980_a2279_1662:48-758(-)
MDIETGQQKTTQANISYVCVSRRTTILASAVPSEIQDKAAAISKTESEVENVLDRLFADSTHRLVYTFTGDTSSFFCIMHESYAFLCMANAAVKKSRGLEFLNAVKDFFLDSVKGEDISSSPKNSLDSRFHTSLTQMMAEYTAAARSGSKSRLSEIKEDIYQVREQLVECVELLLRRGELLNQLLDEVTLMKEKSFVFKQQSSALKKDFCGRNVKMVFMILLLLAGIGVGVWYLLS